jgi:hypothetical protein
MNSDPLCNAGIRARWWLVSLIGVVGLAVGAGPALAETAAPAKAAPAKPEPAEPAAGAALSGDVEDLKSRLSATEAALEAQSADMRKLAEDLSAEREARMEAEQAIGRAEEAARSAPPTVGAVRAGLSLGGFLQADVPFRQASEDEINGTTGDLLNQNRFYLRRARVRLSLIRTYLEGAFELDGNTVSGPTARAIGAEASVKLPGDAGAPPLLMATIGLFKTPFGFEIGESDRDRLFMERSTAEQALFPGEYDGGARLSGGWRFLRYALGVMNGEPIGERTFPGRDPNKAKDLVGRLGVDIPIIEGATIRGGFSALSGHGFHKGTPATKDVIQWRDLNSNRVIDPGELMVVAGAAPTPSFNFDRSAFGGDLGVSVGWRQIFRTTVYGEFYLAQNLDRAVLPYEPSAPGAASVRELGYYAALTQGIGSHLVLGVRYDHYNPDRDATETRVGKLVTRDRSLDTLALAAALVVPYGRLMLEYDRNRNHQGRDLVGRPTNLEDDAFIVRGQVNF